MKVRPEAGSIHPAVPAKPTALLIGGYAGSGKTELGRAFARLTRWPILDKDTTTRPVVEQALRLLGLSPHDRESSLYRTEIRPAEYDALFAAMIENVECGTSVIVTAPFVLELADEVWCERTATALSHLGAQLRVIWVRCDADSMYRYVQRRDAARDAGKLINWQGYLAGLDPDFAPVTQHTIIHNSLGSRPLLEQAERVLASFGYQ